MNIPHYPVIATESSFRYRFISRGSNGDIEKLVEFREMETAGVYNLGFGDVREGSIEIDDLARTGNNDLPKVLATVAAIAYDFMLQYPGAIVFATGSSSSRTRLYQMSLGIHLHWLVRSFAIFGFRDGQWEAFRTGNNYEAFYAVRTA